MVYESILFSAISVSVDTSELNRKILSTHALNILIFVLMLYLLLLKKCSSFLIALFGNCFLLLIFSLVSGKLPMILHFIDSSGPFLVNIYSSNFVDFQASLFQFWGVRCFSLFLFCEGCMSMAIRFHICVFQSDGGPAVRCYVVGIGVVSYC